MALYEVLLLASEFAVWLPGLILSLGVARVLLPYNLVVGWPALVSGGAIGVIGQAVAATAGACPGLVVGAVLVAAASGAFAWRA